MWQEMWLFEILAPSVNVFTMLYFPTANFVMFKFQCQHKWACHEFHTKSLVTVYNLTSYHDIYELKIYESEMPQKQNICKVIVSQGLVFPKELYNCNSLLT